MCRSLRVLGILAVAGAVTIMTAPAWAGGRGGGPGMRGGGGQGASGGGAQPAASIPSQFFGQTQARQTAFFSQSVFPQSNFVVTPMFQPGLGGIGAIGGTGSVYISPPMSNILPPLYVTGYQPGFYVAPTTYSVGGAYVPQATVVYPAPQPLNSYSTGSYTSRIGLIGRW